MTDSSAAGAGAINYPTLSLAASSFNNRGAPCENPSTSRRLGDTFKRLTRAERRAIRYTQLQLALLNRRKKRVAGGWVSLEVDGSVRRSIEAHMARSK